MENYSHEQTVIELKYFLYYISFNHADHQQLILTEVTKASDMALYVNLVPHYIADIR
jgi:hypothetical protein